MEGRTFRGRDHGARLTTGGHMTRSGQRSNDSERAGFGWFATESNARRIGYRIAISFRRGRCRWLPPPKESAVNKVLGIVLIVLGLFGLAWGGFAYTTREKLVDIGPIHATREQTHNVPLPPIAGALALVGGVVLLVTGRKG